MKKLLFVILVLAVSCMAYAQAPAGGTLSVLFPPYSADLRAVDTDQAIANSQVFTQVARRLADNPQLRVLIDGHANAVLGTNLEERQSLRPLSQRRAAAAANFLVNYYNIDRSRLIISGSGGGYPLSSSDGTVNRRVTFVIVTP